ncbi:hypothetical protein ABEI56_04635 [Peribacillus castrilensis]|uniref:hypothetical protein n=1 Tax=Peribacillus castrilensis TaxID=2897690 RepID=UPI003D2C0D88
MRKTSDVIESILATNEEIKTILETQQRGFEIRMQEMNDMLMQVTTIMTEEGESK